MAVLPTIFYGSTPPMCLKLLVDSFVLCYYSINSLKNILIFYSIFVEVFELSALISIWVLVALD